MSSEPVPPIDTIHDLGCRCWPHVSQKALAACQEAAIETTRLEYLEGRKALAAYRADLIEKVRALPGSASGHTHDAVWRAAVLRLLTDGAEPQGGVH